MENETVVHPQVRTWLERSILQPYILEFCLRLQRSRYRTSTIHCYLYCVAHFAHWARRHRVALIKIDERATTRFIAEHLPHCDCPYPVKRGKSDTRAALSHLLKTLYACGVATENRIDEDPLHAELDSFDRYMMDVKGLAQNTRQQRIHIVRRFLNERFASGSVAPDRILPTDIRRFVLGREGVHSTGTIHVVGGAIRCYLQFRSVAGDPVRGLLDAVPSVAHWRLVSLPEVLSKEEVRQLLGSFEQLERSPKRAQAMVRCLTDIGLRASEVVQLHLSDIDWRAGTIRLAANKSRRVDSLPLPPETGYAIAEYLRAERPQTSNRALFVRDCAPIDKPIQAGVVRRAVRQAYLRCGLAHSRVHILRHSLASRLLQVGTPLKEIADILRHRSLDTSVIYTKVDTNRLAAVAMPWPGRSL
jgi:site-specific recombinase XerD